jgi:transketolase
VLSAIGGIELWAPADAIDVMAAVASLLAKPRPAYLRASREPASALPLGAGVVRTNGAIGKVVLLSTGLASQWASEAVAALAQRGVLMPWSHVARLDEAVLHGWTRLHPLMTHVVVLEDHSTIGGLADTLRRIAAPNLQVSSLGWPGHWHGEAGPINALRSAHGLDTAAIIRRIEELL